MADNSPAAAETSDAPPNSNSMADTGSSSSAPPLPESEATDESSASAEATSTPQTESESNTNTQQPQPAELEPDVTTTETDHSTNVESKSGPSDGVAIESKEPPQQKEGKILKTEEADADADSNTNTNDNQPSAVALRAGSLHSRDTSNLFSQKILSPITFDGIHCWAPGRSKQILTDVSGFVRPGEMLAVMGPSGSGKTTMLNVLSQKLPPQLVEGTLQIGHKVVTKDDRRTMGFVFQDDLLLENLSVQETIMVSAELKLPIDMPTEEKEARVATLVDILGLDKVKTQNIGSIGRRGISGGERKRTAVANELVTAPAVLFLDEPTSGLDSTSAWLLVETLRSLCDQGMTIICCIHQPRENIFTSFDQLLLLVDGRTAYFGPPKQIQSHLEGLALPSLSGSGVHLAIPPFTNVADWILDLMSDKAVATEIADVWQQTKKEALQKEIQTARGR